MTTKLRNLLMTDLWWNHRVGAFLEVMLMKACGKKIKVRLWDFVQLPGMFKTAQYTSYCLLVLKPCSALRLKWALLWLPTITVLINQKFSAWFILWMVSCDLAGGAPTLMLSLLNMFIIMQYWSKQIHLFNCTSSYWGGINLKGKQLLNVGHKSYVSEPRVEHHKIKCLMFILAVSCFSPVQPSSFLQIQWLN